VLSALQYTVVSRDETLETPAGTIQNCVHIRIAETIPGYDPENAAHREVEEYRSDTEYWLAPDIGLVRIGFRYPNMPDSGSRMELAAREVKPDPARRYFPLTEGSVWEYAVYDHCGNPMEETYDYKARCRVDTVTEDMAYLAWSGHVRSKR